MARAALGPSARFAFEDSSYLLPASLPKRAAGKSVPVPLLRSTLSAPASFRRRAVQVPAHSNLLYAQAEAALHTTRLPAPV